jgi:carbon monoxide dehydrogenase subunit G
MPAVVHSVVVDAPLPTTWAFVRDMHNWAELVPGFEGFTAASDIDSEWKVRGDVGILTKLVTFDVHVNEWVEQSHVQFSMVCREEPLKADGSLTAGRVDDARTSLDFALDANAGGMLGPVVNALLKTVLPRMASDFAGSIKRAIEAPNEHDSADRGGVHGAT